MRPCVFAAFTAEEIDSFIAVKQHGQIILLKGLQGFVTLAAGKLHCGQASISELRATHHQPLCGKSSSQSALQSTGEEPGGHPVTFW